VVWRGNLAVGRVGLPLRAVGPGRLAGALAYHAHAPRLFVPSAVDPPSGERAGAGTATTEAAEAETINAGGPGAGLLGLPGSMVGGTNRLPSSTPDDREMRMVLGGPEPEIPAGGKSPPTRAARSWRGCVGVPRAAVTPVQEFIASIVGALAWPGAAVALAALLRKPIMRLFVGENAPLRLSSVSVNAGVVSAQWDRSVTSVAVAVAESTATGSAAPGGLAHLGDVADENPAGAVLQAYEALELTLRELLSASESEAPASYRLRRPYGKPPHAASSTSRPLLPSMASRCLGIS
jgi:hypothetical protein